MHALPPLAAEVYHLDRHTCEGLPVHGHGMCVVKLPLIGPASLFASSDLAGEAHVRIGIQIEAEGFKDSDLAALLPFVLESQFSRARIVEAKTGARPIASSSVADSPLKERTFRRPSRCHQDFGRLEPASFRQAFHAAKGVNLPH